jgi:hypothetical protein
MRLARVGNTARNSGNRNPPRWTKAVYLQTDTCLSATFRKVALCLRNFRFAQSESLILTRSTFRMHSQIEITNSRSQFDTMAFRNLGFAALSTWRAW